MKQPLAERPSGRRITNTLWSPALHFEFAGMIAKGFCASPRMRPHQQPEFRFDSYGLTLVISLRMDASLNQAELFPVIERKLGRFARWRVLAKAIEENGPMVARAMLPVLLDVSKQRVYQLITEGRIARLQVNGQEMIPVASIEAFLADERKGGRPVRERTLRESYRVGFGLLK